MTLRVAINGYGRIGRNILRALYESGRNKDIRIVAINDLGDAKINAHLTEYDSVHGRFSARVAMAETSDDCLLINEDRIRMFSERDPSSLPWKELAIDVVLECTGRFTNRQAAASHLQAGAKTVLVSAPCAEADATIVYGVNHSLLTSAHRVISNASCTTNCLAPLAKVLNTSVGITQGQMTTVHAYTNDQLLTDSYHSDFYRARSATQSMIPTKTGAASALGIVLPELSGKLDGISVRVPTINVSLVDLTFIASRETTANEINDRLLEASQNEFNGILTYNTRPLVSIDYNHNPASCCFDANHTKAQGRLVKVMAWYDNEWGFSNRMLDTAMEIYQKIR